MELIIVIGNFLTICGWKKSFEKSTMKKPTLTPLDDDLNDLPHQNNKADGLMIVLIGFVVLLGGFILGAIALEILP